MKRYFIKPLAWCLILLLAISPALPITQVFGADDGLILRYTFEDGVIDVSGNGLDGVIHGDVAAFGGIAVMDGGYIQIPADVIETDAITISAWVYHSTAQEYARVWDLGGVDQHRYYNLLIRDNNQVENEIRKVENTSMMTVLNSGSANQATVGGWVHIVSMFTNGLARLYINGVCVAEESLPSNTNRLANPRDILDGSRCYIGKSRFSKPETNTIYNDPNFRGYISDFKVYGRVLSTNDILAEAADMPTMDRTNLVRRIKDAVDNADYSVFDNVAKDITMPRSPDEDVNFTWESSNPTILNADGSFGGTTVTQTVAMTMTAKSDDSPIRYNGNVIKYAKSFNAIVRTFGDVLNEDAETLSMVRLIDTPHFYLPSNGKLGSDITWESSDLAVLDPSKIKPEENVNQPSYNEGVKYVTLTATLSIGGQSVQKVFANRMVIERYKAFLLSYFGGAESNQAERYYATVHFAYSYDGLHWTPLNGNNTIVAATILGRDNPVYGQDRPNEALARDPVVYRQQDGLLRLMSSHSWNNHDIYVWDAGDLTSFSGERLLSVNNPKTGSKGNAWAPECVWDAKLEKNMIIFTDPNTPYNGGYGTYTDDFTQTNVDAYRELDMTNVPLLDMTGTPVYRYIDVSMYLYNGVYYMPVRYWSGQPVDGVAVAKAPELGYKTFSPMQPNESVGYGNNEGPFIIKALDRDRWYMYYDYPDSGNDEYSGSQGGFFGASYTDDIDDPNGWKRIPNDDYSLPLGVRHGNAIPITELELEKLINKWGAPSTLDIAMLSKNETRVDVGTDFGDLGLPGEVEVTMLDGASKMIPVNWDPTNYKPDDGRYKVYGEFDLAMLPNVANTKNFRPYYIVYVGKYASSRGLIVDVGFEDITGDTALDSSGYGNSIQFFNNQGTPTTATPTTLATTRPNGGGRMLDTVNNQLWGKFPDELLMDATDMTVAFWFNTRTNQNWSRIFSFGKGTSNYMNFISREGDSPNAMRVEFRKFNEHRQIRSGNANVVPTNQWNHVAITYNPATRTSVLYRNGVEISRNNDFYYGPADFGKNTRNFFLRAQFSPPFNSPGDPLFNGWIDDFKVYDYALTAKEVFDLYSDADELGIERTLIVDGNSVIADITIRNNTTKNADIMALIAAYDADGRFVGVETDVLYAAKKSTLPVNMRIDAVDGAAYYKLFIWDSITFAPLISELLASA